MRYCDKCGGPLRDTMKFNNLAPKGIRWHRMNTDDGCRLCWLALPPLFRLRTILWRGISVDDGNSTADSPATSTWLPDGAREASPMSHDRAMWIIQPWLE